MRLFLWATRRLHAFRSKDHILCIFVRYLHLYITITNFNKKCVIIFLGESSDVLWKLNRLKPWSLDHRKPSSLYKMHNVWCEAVTKTLQGLLSSLKCQLFLKSLDKYVHAPDTSPLACSPCWGPKLWRRGSHVSSYSVRCDWTSRPRWRRWSQRRRIGCLGPQAPRRLKKRKRNHHNPFFFQQCAEHGNASDLYWF